LETDRLIASLAADAQNRGAPLGAVWWGAAGLAVLAAAAVFYATIGPRPDIASAAETVRFLFKFVVTTALTASALGMARALSRPEATGRLWLPALAVAPALLAAAVLVELAVLPSTAWSMSAAGKNGLVCLTYVPLIGIGPLAIFLLTLRHGAPTHPGLAGAATGLAAGGIATTFYAAHCTDDSPLFVAVWYTLAIVLLASIGALAARFVARW
jgi:hypothetical protein